MNRDHVKLVFDELKKAKFIYMGADWVDSKGFVSDVTDDMIKGDGRPESIAGIAAKLSNDMGLYKPDQSILDGKTCGGLDVEAQIFMNLSEEEVNELCNPEETLHQIWYGKAYHKYIALAALSILLKEGVVSFDFRKYNHELSFYAMGDRSARSATRYTPMEAFEEAILLGFRSASIYVIPPKEWDMNEVRYDYNI